MYTQQELQEFTQAEQELAGVGLIVEDRFNTEVIIGYFDQHPELPVTKQNVISFVNHPQVKDRLHWKPEARIKYDKATIGYEQRHQDVLDGFLKSFHLVHDPSDDRTYENCAAIFDAMKGREWTTDNLRWVVDYLSGRGKKLHWLERPSQRINRGHIANSPDDFRFAPKESTNQHPLSKHSHSSNPRFNGQEDREKMRLKSQPPDDPMASHNIGRTHSETERIQKVASQTPGGGRAAYEAGLREQRIIENEHARGR